MKRLYLNNLGLINALGTNKEDVFLHLIKNDQTNVITFDQLHTKRSTYIATINHQFKDLEPKYHLFNCRNNQMLSYAYDQIKDSVENLKEKYGKNRIGIVLGTSTSGILEGEKAIEYYHQHETFPKKFNYKQQELGQIALFLAQYADITGISYTISTACSSSGKAILAGQRLIESNLCDAVIVGGCDSLCQMTLNGFDALDSVSNTICQPFSQNRNGITIGEGAALFILSKEPAEIALLGGGESSDGYHITSPDPQGLGAKLAIERALINSQIDKSLIGYINAHGTATIKNDQMESKAIFDLFKDTVPITSTKPLTGHTLGAASATELGLLWLLLHERYNPHKQIPGQIWDNKKGDDIAEIGIPNEPFCFQKDIFLSNSFAFGGNNVALVIARS